MQYLAISLFNIQQAYLCRPDRSCCYYQVNDHIGKVGLALLRQHFNTSTRDWFKQNGKIMFSPSKSATYEAYLRKY